MGIENKKVYVIKAKSICIRFRDIKHSSLLNCEMCMCVCIFMSSLDKLLLNPCLKELNYMLVRIDESKMQSECVKPILGDSSQLPRVVEFLPDGLKFLKPADATIRYETTVSNSELCVLHGSYSRDYQRTVWELVTNDIEENNAEGIVNMKINSFCFFCYIVAKRGKLAQILSHLNHSFTCRAYALYRRLPSMDTIDISVVLLSEFVDEKEEDIKQLKDHFEEGYLKGEKGMLKRVHTDRRFEMSLDFPGVEKTLFVFKVDQAELDSVGFVIDRFKGIPVKSPANGIVKICEVHRSGESELLWKLSIHEMKEEIAMETFPGKRNCTAIFLALFCTVF